MATYLCLVVDAWRGRRSRHRRFRGYDVAAGHRQRRQAWYRPRQLTAGCGPYRACGGAGAGAAVGLMLAFRRQHHQEIATVLTDLDATERRITELYAKAVEQLGSDKAPVRLGGLYALERLAQDNPAHHQTIVNVICAYLRMPFSATPPASEPEPEATEAPEMPSAEAETNTLALGGTWSRKTRGSRKDRCGLPRSVSLLNICVTTGIKISAPPILRARVSGPTCALISSAPLLSTSVSRTA